MSQDDRAGSDREARLEAASAGATPPIPTLPVATPPGATPPGATPPGATPPGASSTAGGPQGAPVSGEDPLEAYLDRMFDLLAGTGATGRRALAEVEDHLREALTDGVVSGLSEVDAQRAALARFGPPEKVATDLVPLSRNLRLSLRRLVSSAVLLGCLGLVAIGVSGLVAAALGAAYGKPFVSGDTPGVTYTADRCADFLEYHPEAGTCTAAATAHHFDEVVWYRAYAGMLGLVGLFAFWALRRTPAFRGAAWAPRSDLVAIGGAGAFALGSLVFGGSGAIDAASGVHGAGQFVSAGLVSVVAFAAFLPLLLRTVRGRGTVT